MAVATTSSELVINSHNIPSRLGQRIDVVMPPYRSLSGEHNESFECLGERRGCWEGPRANLKRMPRGKRVR